MLNVVDSLFLFFFFFLLLFLLCQRPLSDVAWLNAQPRAPDREDVIILCAHASLCFFSSRLRTLLGWQIGSRHNDFRFSQETRRILSPTLCRFHAASKRSILGSFFFTGNFYLCRDICEFRGNLKAEKCTEPCNKRNYVHRMFKVRKIYRNSRSDCVVYLWRLKRIFVAIFVKI